MQRRDGGSLVGGDLVVADDADDELVPERPRLAQRVAVAVVHHVEAAVHVDPHRAAAPPEPPPEGLDGRQARGRGASAEVERDHRGAQHDATDHARRHRPRAAAPRIHGRARWY